MKFLPPRLQLDERMAATGSYPTVARFSVDGRTGNYSVSFDDTKTIVYGPYSDIEYGVGLPSGSFFLSSDVAFRQNETATEFSGSGNVIKGIGDLTPMVRFTPGQEGGPFRDNDQYAVDGKSSNSDFYSTGTPISVTGEEGFDVPLWSKDKIEIDISPSQITSHGALVDNFEDETFDQLSTPMMYYNFASKKWQGIGNEYWYNRLRPQDGQRNHCIGFAGGLVNVPYAAQFPLDIAMDINLYYFFELMQNAGSVTDAYGFPYDARYHAVPECTFKLSDVIDRPFVVEKVDVILECQNSFDANIQNGTRNAFYGGGTFNLTASFVPASVNNIFLMVQRKNANININNEVYKDETGLVTQSMLPESRVIARGDPTVYVNTIRDLVTYGKITAYAANMPEEWDRASLNLPGDVVKKANIKALMAGDVNIETGIPMTNSLNALNWGRRKLHISMEAKVPSKNAIATSAVSETKNPVANPPPSDGYYYWGMRTVTTEGGSNNLGVTYPSGRQLVGPLQNIINKGNVTLFNDPSVPSFDVPQVAGELTKTSPYILQPSDELILGWQLPYPTCLDEWTVYTTGTGLFGPEPGTGLLNQVDFFSAPSKIVLYGSYLSAGRPKNDSLNQLLSSDSAHEVIGED